MSNTRDTCFDLAELVKHWVFIGCQIGKTLDDRFDVTSERVVRTLDHLGVSMAGLKPMTPRIITSGISSGTNPVPKKKMIRDGLLKQNLRWIQNKFHLSHLEISVLTLIYASQKHQLFSNFLSEFSFLNSQKLILLIANFISSDEITVRQLLDHESNLVKLGLIKPKLYEDGVFSARFHILDVIQDYIEFDQLSIGHFCKDIVRSGFAELKLHDFPHMLEDIEDLKIFIGQVCDDKTVGINLLIHGPESSGKTQFIRSLADTLNIALYQINTQSLTGASSENKIKSVLRAQLLLEGEKNSLLIVDDFHIFFDSEFSDSLISTFNPHIKKLINISFNKNKTPTVWLTNRLDIFSFRDMARFNFCLEFKKPTRLMRQDFLRRKLDGLIISDTWVTKTALKENIPFETLEKISHFTKSICKSRSDICVEEVFDRALRKSTQYMNFGQTDLNGFNVENYSSEFINADVALNDVCDSLKIHSEARLCLAGPPGCGKTAYAYYLAFLLEKPVIAKKASDILGRYLGDTEQNLANSFVEAKNSDAILLIDEVDGLLIDRKDAIRGWEISMVNELLTQIDNYQGLLVVTTNLFEKIDMAAMRRFDLKVTFDYLNAFQISKLWDIHIDRFNLTADPDVRKRCISINGLTPGDFANIERQSKFLPIRDCFDLFERLLKEVTFKKSILGNKQIGFLSVT